MAFLFFDTSALAKAYFDEIGSAWVQSLLEPAAKNTIYITNITSVEFTSAVARRLKGSLLTAAEATAALNQFRIDRNGSFHVVDVTPQILQQAESSAESYALRAYDAVQLSVLSHLDNQLKSVGVSALTLISADNELNDASVAEGIAVDDPNAHP